MEKQQLKKNYQQAIEHHLSGDLNHAEDIYQKILAAVPTHHHTHYMLGSLYLSQKNFEQAGLHLQSAFDSQPKNSLYHCALGRLYKAQQQFQQAEKFLKQSVELSTPPKEAFNELAILYIDKEKFSEALEFLAQGIKIFPKEKALYYNMAIALEKQYKIEAAINTLLDLIQLNCHEPRLYTRLTTLYKKNNDTTGATSICLSGLQQYPKDYVLHNEISLLYADKSHMDKAIEHYRISLNIKDNQSDVCNNLANLYAHIGDSKNALSYYEKALKLNPKDPRALNNFANLLKKLHYHRDAAKYFQCALEIDPESAAIQNNFGSLLLEMGYQIKAMQCFANAIKLDSNIHIANSNFLLASNYCSDDAESIFKHHKVWGDITQKKSPAENPVTIISKKNKIRVGFVSGDFRKHSVSYFLNPIFQNYPKDKFEFYAYADVLVQDSFSKKLKDCIDQWHDITAKSDIELANMIRDDEIDILFDLAGHTAKNRLLVFAQKPAPIQITYIGYPNTTGMHTMDYRIVDFFTDPDGADKYATEKLLRMPNCFLCYEPFFASPDVAPLPALNADTITFASFNNLAKITPDLIKLWSQLINAIPNSHLLVKAKPLVDDITKKEYYDLFNEAGLDSDRITFMGSVRDSKQHLSVYNKVDIALDTFPYHGTTTTCEALWMGVPVITLAGDRHASRVGVSLLNNAGLSQCVAENETDYINIAKNLASDLTALNELRQSLREKMQSSSLVDQQRFCQDFFQLIESTVDEQ